MEAQPDFSLSHECVNGGADSAMILSKHDSQQVPETASLFDRPIEMKKFSYNLLEDSIAVFPADPRGSSKLLYVDSNGEVTFASNFAETFPSLAEGCHVVFNESRVLEARLFIHEPSNEGEHLEMMILDLGDVDLHGQSASKTPLNVMLRREEVEKGEIFHIPCKDEIVKVVVDQVLW